MTGEGKVELHSKAGRFTLTNISQGCAMTRKRDLIEIRSNDSRHFSPKSGGGLAVM